MASGEAYGDRRRGGYHGPERRLGRRRQADQGDSGALKVAGYLKLLDAVLGRLQKVSLAVIWAGIGIVAVFAADREPPFFVRSVDPVSGKPGQTIEIQASVHREPGRGCRVSMYDTILDSDGSRFVVGRREFSPELIRKMDELTPGRIKVAVQIPLSATPGPAQYLSVAKFRCNKIHSIWPIEQTIILPFEISP
jgi:hypothetical protein